MMQRCKSLNKCENFGYSASSLYHSTNFYWLTIPPEWQETYFKEDITIISGLNCIFNIVTVFGIGAEFTKCNIAINSCNTASLLWMVQPRNIVAKWCNHITKKLPKLTLPAVIQRYGKVLGTCSRKLWI